MRTQQPVSTPTSGTVPNNLQLLVPRNSAVSPPGRSYGPPLPFIANTPVPLSQPMNTHLPPSETKQEVRDHSCIESQLTKGVMRGVAAGATAIGSTMMYYI